LERNKPSPPSAVALGGSWRFSAQVANVPASSLRSRGKSPAPVRTRRGGARGFNWLSKRIPMQNALKTPGSTGSLRTRRDPYGFPHRDEKRPATWYETCKSAVERAIALTLLIVSAPVMRLGAVLG